jgi:hypothetical protein
METINLDGVSGLFSVTSTNPMKIRWNFLIIVKVFGKAYSWNLSYICLMQVQMFTASGLRVHFLKVSIMYYYALCLFFLFHMFWYN